MTDLHDAVNLLKAKRKELADQLDAVDKALAALTGVAGGDSETPEKTPAAATTETDPGIVVPTRLTARRTLSDEHKHAMNEGRRKARHSKAAAAGHARELSDQPPALAPASSADGRQPRLVKRTR
jgi:hypothetical protein